jgi:hypothetical protein
MLQQYSLEVDKEKICEELKDIVRMHRNRLISCAGQGTDIVRMHRNRLISCAGQGTTDVAQLAEACICL